MTYSPSEIEPKWQAYWQEKQTFRTEIDHNRPIVVDFGSKRLLFLPVGLPLGLDLRG